MDENETESLRTELESIVGYIEQLSELDTTGVEPTYQVTDLQNVWRDDAVDNYGISNQKLLALAPATEAQQIKVPKVL
ncbi:MAG: glutamyl-tRNA amidotransferase [Candidatus Saccharibacteria bacterium]|nr:glutamyl-tRNA amidotransferase [Candidatus Saccharibacteria bacterium]MDB5180256.1 glutamyl-tRNA amidotransferase [Candidatus Saccharibacteria bacterium]